MTDHFADGKARNLVEKLVNKGRPRDHNRHIGGVNHLRKTFLFSAFQRFLVFIPSLSWQKDCILRIKGVFRTASSTKDLLRISERFPACRKMSLFFKFSYTCPEPVLANVLFKV